MYLCGVISINYLKACLIYLIHLNLNWHQIIYKLSTYLCSFSIGTDNMLIIDVYVVSATANCERLVLHILSMLVDKRCVQFLILWETPSSDITDLTQLDDISFLEDTVTDKFLHWHQTTYPALALPINEESIFVHSKQGSLF